MKIIKCVGCKNTFDIMESGELHPTEDGILCPFCETLNLFVVELPTWESEQERLNDWLWERGK